MVIQFFYPTALTLLFVIGLGVLLGRDRQDWALVCLIPVGCVVLLKLFNLGSWVFWKTHNVQSISFDELDALISEDQNAWKVYIREVPLSSSLGIYQGIGAPSCIVIMSSKQLYRIAGASISEVIEYAHLSNLMLERIQTI